ncbi:MAG: 4'-phosphopantetheinyl transferase superfamily protein [Luteibacter sp.]
MSEPDRSSAPGFVRLSLARHPGALPDAFMLPFEPGAADAARFASFGIACPPSIGRSVGKRRAEYLAGRRAAVAALREAGSTANDLAIGVSRAPSWPAGFTGSITHADGLAAAVAMPAAGLRGVGIDLEHAVSASALEAIVQTVIDAGEREVLAGLAGHVGWPMACTIAFSAKESFYKATAAEVGRIFEFSALRIVGVDTDGDVVVAEVAEPLAPSLPVGKVFRMGFSPVGTLSVLTSCAW